MSVPEWVYNRPKHGWVCFYCGENFRTPGSARDHFGASPDTIPGCLMKVQLGNERGWLMEIRKLQDELEKQKAEVARLEGALQASETRIRSMRDYEGEL